MEFELEFEFGVRSLVFGVLGVRSIGVGVWEFGVRSLEGVRSLTFEFGMNYELELGVELGVRSIGVSEFWSLEFEFGVRSLVFGVLGVWSLEFEVLEFGSLGVWSLEFGVWSWEYWEYWSIGVWSLEFGSLEFRVYWSLEYWSFEFGVWEFGVWSLKFWNSGVWSLDSEFGVS